MNLKIGVLLLHTNAYPTMGRDFIDGLEMAYAHSPVELFIESIGIGADMGQITGSIQKLLSQHRVHILTGLVGHHQIENLLATLDSLGTPMLYSDLGARLPIALKKRPAIFCNSFDLCHSAFLTGKYMAGQGQTQVAVSSCYYESGYGFVQALEKGLYGSGGQFAGHFITPHTPRESEAELMRQFIDEVKPQAIYAQHSGIFAREHALFLSQNNLANEYPLYASPFSIENSVLNGFPGIFAGTRCITSWMAEDTGKANLEFVSGYAHLYDRQPNVFSLLGYENGKALALVANSAPKYTAAEIKKVLETVSFDSPRGTFCLHPDTHRSSFDQHLWEIASDKGAYRKYKKAEFENQIDFTLGWMNSAELPVGGWYNAYLCQ